MPRTLIFVLLLALSALLLISVLARPAPQSARATHDPGGGSHIDQISIDMGPPGVATGVTSNGLPAVGDRNGDGVLDAEGYDTPDVGDAAGICGNGLDDDLADSDADTVPDLADGSADDGCVLALSSNEICVEIVDNDALDADEDTLVSGTQDRASIDITIGSGAGGGVPADRLFSAWQYQLNWDADVLDVDANNTSFLILASGGAAPFIVVAPAFPVGTSPFVTAVADAGPLDMGPGVLSRVTIEGNAAGLSVLTEEARCPISLTLPAAMATSRLFS